MLLPFNIGISATVGGPGLRVVVMSMVVLLSSGCLTVSERPVTRSPSAEEEARIARLSGLKSQAEEWAKKIKADFPAGKPERAKAEALYISARAALESWLTQVKLDLNSGHEPSASPAAQKLQAESATKAQDFIIYVNQLYVRGSVSPGTITLMSDIFKFLSGPFFDLFGKIATNNEKQEKEMIAILETMKWRPFAEL